ncbi:MAG: peptidase MA family metallohydrolase [Candidatus Aceula lacicola]|nr:peptidase MA family metallohydrolase [Candidatus Aceula lacicola]
MKRITYLLLIILFFGVMPISSASNEWNDLKSRHFIIYYKNAPREFIKTVEQSAEDYYFDIVDELGFTRDQIWTWDERVKIYIYDNQQDYLTLARQASWSAGSTMLGSKVIRTFPSAHGFFDSLLPHELGHIIFRDYVGFESNIPLWFDEGVAMYQEKAKRWGANQEVKSAIQDKSFCSLSDLRLTRKSSQSDVNLFYAESASVVYYLISEFGSFKFLNFCRNLKKGLSFNRALKKSYYRFENVNDLNKTWVGYLKNE